MRRDILDHLRQWKSDLRRKPLLLRGARQVGKSFVVSEFANNEFEQFININFELQPEFLACFQSLKPDVIIQEIELLLNVEITSGKSLLFLDEIQDCPNAIRALRYFKELMPELHVIGAGSLLEFTLANDNFRMPVGRVQYIYLYPLSFREFLSGTAEERLRLYLDDYQYDATISTAVHERLTQLVRTYNVIGGMPDAVAEYSSSGDFNRCFNIHTGLLKTYRDDFGKYAKSTELNHLQKLFERVPGLVSQHFKYVAVDESVRARQVKIAVRLLNQAGLIHLVYQSAANTLPLNLTLNEKKFKLLMLDVGLVTRLSDLNVQKLLSDDLLLANRGALAEQFVGQELLAYHDVYSEAALYYWEGVKPQSTAEIDYVICVDGQIVPVEVKAGSTGRLKSLKQFMQKHNLPLGVRISQHPLQLEGNILSVPFYLISKLSELIRAV